MRVFVKAKPMAKEEKVEKIDETHFVVSVKEPPVKGRANAAIALSLAKYFSAPVSAIVLISGFASRDKMFEIRGL